MRYMVIIEPGPNSFGAYIPDLYGCIAVGESEQEVLQLVEEAVNLHLADLNNNGTAFYLTFTSSGNPQWRMDTTTSVTGNSSFAAAILAIHRYNRE